MRYSVGFGVNTYLNYWSWISALYMLVIETQLILLPFPVSYHHPPTSQHQIFSLAYSCPFPRWEAQTNAIRNMIIIDIILKSTLYAFKVACPLHLHVFLYTLGDLWFMNVLPLPSPTLLYLFKPQECLEKNSTTRD